jgi:hypothetical protein
LPSVRVAAQKGFKDDELDDASQYLFNLRLGVPHSGLRDLLGGKPLALEFVFVTTEDVTWNQVLAHQRRRVQSQVLRQEGQPPFDERLLKRSRQLGDKQRAALAALLQLRRNYSAIPPVAVQLDLEHSFETEFSAEAFDLPVFLEQGWKWSESVRGGVTHLDGDKK